MEQIPLKMLVAALVLLGAAAPAFSQQVEASLSSESTVVGSPVQLTIQVSGARNAEIPRNLVVDGLRILPSGRTQEFRMLNFKTSYLTTFTFALTPTREGVFQIPPLLVQIDGKTVQTRPLTLRVDAAGSGSRQPPALRGYPPQLPQGQPGIDPFANQPPQPRRPPPNPEKATFAELLGFGERKFIYVGEVIPVELRFYFDAEFPTQVGGAPSFVSDGFTVQRFPEPKQMKQEIDGRTYNVLSYRTTLTAVKSGTLEIPPASVEARIQYPSDSPDAFGGMFGGMFSGVFGETREVLVKTQPLSIQVEALPKEGQPENFSGAIGDFTIAAKASPTKAGPGDPVTLAVTVSGRGNFEAMGPPQLVEAEGWQTYPPGEKLEPSVSDPTGYIGSKIFDFTMIARQDQKASPSAEFSYFDPAKAKYLTVSTKPIALTARAGKPADQVVSSPPAPAAEPTPPPAEQTGLSSDFQSGSFVPLVLSRKFLVANAVAAGLWALLLVFFLIRKAQAAAATGKNAVRRERKRLIQKMENPSCEEKEFYELASRVIEMQLPPQNGSSDAFAGVPLPEEARRTLQGVLQRRDELKFSSNGRGEKLGAEVRLEILRQLKEFNEKVR